MRSFPAEFFVRRPDLSLLFAFAFLSICFTGQFAPFANPNELSRLQAVYSFVENGTFAIDGTIAIFGDHEDKSVWDGHFYSNKAPGLTFAAIPVYRALRLFFPRPESRFAPVFLLLRVLVVTPVCLLALARFLALLRRRGAPAPALVTAALAFGTPFLFYSRSFFSHAWTAALIFLSLDLILRAEEAGSQRRAGSLLLGAGVLAGWAAISEYPLALFALLLWARSFSRRSPGRAVFFALGLLPPLALLLAYDAACFGSPLTLSSAREAAPRYAALVHQGLFGFGPPSPRIALKYLLHPARGVLLFSPFFAWAVVGFVRWWRRREHRADWAFCFFGTLLFFVAMCGYPNWHGGWSLGNRYLMPLLFPVGLALAHSLDSPRSRLAFAAAAVFSVATHVLLCSAWPHFPDDVAWPAASGSLWFLQRGWAAPGILGEPPGWAPVAVVISAAAAALALAPAIASAQLPPGRVKLSILAGLLLFAVTLALAPRPSFWARLWRAEIFTSLGRDPSFGELQDVVESARSPEERQRALISWRLYGPRPGAGTISKTFQRAM